MVVKTTGNEDGVNRLWWHRVQVAMHFYHSNCTNFIVTQGESRDAGPCYRGGGTYPETGHHRVVCRSAFVGTGPSRVFVLAHRLRPNGIS